MGYRESAIFNALQLPAYWRACRRSRAAMDVVVKTVFYGDHPRQYYLDVQSASQPVIPGRHACYFHGGAWTFGRPETFVPAAAPWVAMGFRVIMPSYRRPPRAWLGTIVEDVRCALRDAAPAAPVQHFHLGGISAGGHLAALLASRPEKWSRMGWSKPPDKALICAAPVSLEHLRPRLLFTPYQHLNPVAQIGPARPDSPSWFFLHGTSDATVRYEHSRIFSQALQNLGHRAQLHTIPGGTHLDAGRWMFGEIAADPVREFIRGSLRDG